MYPVSAQYLEALRVGYRMEGYVEAWRSGAQLTYIDGEGLPRTKLPLVADANNVVTVDGSSPGPRRTLSVTLAPLPGLWDLLSPVGTELRAFHTVEYTHGLSETIPQGVFDIDVQRMGYGADETISVTAPDRWQRIVNARFAIPRAASAGVNMRVQIATLIAEALPGGIGLVDTATTTVNTPIQVWEDSRAKAIQDLAKAAAVDVGFDRTGVPFIRNAPVLSENVVWTVDASAQGVLIAADRERNRQSTYNVVKIMSEASTKGDPLFAPQFVWDNNPLSPTYAGPDPITSPGLAGPFGVRMFTYSSPLVADATAALAAGRVLLEQASGLAAQLSLQAAPNPALDDGDTIQVVLPRERYDVPRPVERHVVRRLTVPLTPGAAQSIDTRSTVADIDEGGA